MDYYKWSITGLGVFGKDLVRNLKCIFFINILIHTMCALKIPTLVQNAHLHHLINILEQQTGMD